MSKIVELANFAFRERKRIALATAVVFGTTLLLGSPSSATPPRGGALSIHQSFGSVASMCGKDGGEFKVATNGGYGCEQKDGSGVYCTGKGACTDYPGTGTPDVKRRNGTGHPPSSAGAASSVPIKNKVSLDSGGRVSHSRIHKH
jgi:hypothetical protein